MSTFVLVHGAWHGGWCWYKVVSRLQAQGHNAIAIDLPGMGTDNTSLAEVTLASWNDALVEVIQAQDQPVVLVGHSRGGLNISAAAETVPEKIAKLVYLCAFVPQNEQSLFDLSAQDASSNVRDALVPSADGVSTTVKESALKDTFYGDCSDDDVALAKLCLKPEPLAALATPFFGSAERFGRVPKAYIECLQDRAISIEAQRRMAAACDQVETMDVSHSPFFSAPDELTRILISMST